MDIEFYADDLPPEYVFIAAATREFYWDEECHPTTPDAPRGVSQTIRYPVVGRDGREKMKSVDLRTALENPEIALMLEAEGVFDKLGVATELIEPLRSRLPSAMANRLIRRGFIHPFSESTVRVRWRVPVDKEVLRANRPRKRVTDSTESVRRDGQGQTRAPAPMIDTGAARLTSTNRLPTSDAASDPRPHRPHEPGQQRSMGRG